MDDDVDDDDKDVEFESAGTNFFCSDKLDAEETAGVVFVFVFAGAFVPSSGL